jgi:spore germination cell wall hydrolase CwlJ-like protein
VRKADRTIFDSLTDQQLLALCIEREAGGEPTDGKIAVGTIVLERVDHRKWDGNTIKEVIMWPWQFSWTMPEAGREYYEEAVRIATDWTHEYQRRPPLQICFGIAAGMLQGEIPRDKELAAVNCCQYLNPKVAPLVKEKWLKAGMTLIKAIGKHEFFKEA